MTQPDVPPAHGRLASALLRLRPGADSPDREFLAPALEILETPPSPIGLAFVWLICALAAAGLAGASFGRLDIVASARGKLQPTGRVKVVEPLETGRVAAIGAANGALVRAGDTLVELDRPEAEAEMRTASAERAAAEAEIVRRKAALAAAGARAFSPPKVDWPAALDAHLCAREERVLAAGLGELAAAVASLDAEGAQKAAERAKLEQTIATQKALVATLKERVDMRTRLVEEKAGARAAVIDATETLQYQITQEAKQEEELASLTAGRAMIEREIDKAVESFMSDEADKLEAAEQRAEGDEQRVAKAAAGLDRLTLRAPIAGRVQSSVIANVGQVVRSGEEVMRIVPEDAGLEIEAYVLNRDIGFVHPGQAATVKIDAFPFTRYGAIAAHVTRVARDAIPAADAAEIEGDPARASAAAGFAGAERTQNLVFPVTLAPDATTIRIDGADQPLTSGMAATVELKTGSRRMIEFLLAPLFQVTGALRER